MRPTLPQLVLHAIRREQMLRPGDRVGVGVSGGADSVSLLLLLEDLRDDLGVVLKVVHLNHGLRGKESEADEAFVAELACAHSVEFLCAREDVSTNARAEGWNLEDAGRRIRRKFFSKLVNQGKVDRVAVAHTADDQAETVLAHILRGSGPAGLAGIYPVAPPIVRPLLGIRRSELRAYLQQRNQPWREDRTNRDLTRQRARVRHELLPLLASHFSEHVVSHLRDLADVLRAEEAVWSLWTEERLRSLFKESGEGFSVPARDLSFPAAGLSWLPPGEARREPGTENHTPREANRALARRLVRRVLTQMAEGRGEFGLRHVDGVLRFAKSAAGGHELHLPGGIVVIRNFEDLLFRHRSAGKENSRGKAALAFAGAYAYELELPTEGVGSVSIPEIGLCVRLKLIDWPRAPRDTMNKGFAVDARRLQKPLILRNWRPGDALRPPGRSRPRKLKEFFRSARVPARERPSWPVLTSAGELVWARGFPPAEEFSAGPATQKALVIEAESMESPANGLRGRHGQG